MEISPEPTPPPAEGARLIALVPGDGLEPSADLPDREAAAIWSAVSALWHPALLASSVELPRIEDVVAPTPPDRRDLRLVAAGASDRLPPGYRDQAERAGAILVEGDADRGRTLGRLFERLQSFYEAPPPPLGKV